MIKLYWYITGYIRKHGLKFLAVILASAVVFTLILPSLFRFFYRRQTYYVGLVGEYDLTNLPDEVKSQLSRSLVRFDETCEFDENNLDLAAKLEIEDGGRRYRFTLEDGLVWQDGKAFEARDVTYRLRDAQVTYEGNQVIYDLPAPLASFPQALTEPLLRLEHVKKFGLFDQIRVWGIGATQLTSYDWIDSSHHALSQVVLDDFDNRARFVYRFYYTQDEAVEAFKLGKIDFLNDVTNISDVKDWEITNVRERKLTNQYLAVFFNADDPQLSRGVRQALSYAVEKERAGYERAIGPINERCSWAYFSGAKKYDKNIDSAVERLLDELPGEPIELNLVTTTAYYDIAESVKKDWEELGEAAVTACQQSEDIPAENKNQCEYLRIQVHIQIQTIPDTNNFQTMLVGQKIPLDPDQYSLWHSGLATNFTHYKNTRVDKLLEEGRQKIKTSERGTIYQEFQQNLLEDPPAIFLWHLTSFDLARGDNLALIDLSKLRHREEAPVSAPADNVQNDNTDTPPQEENSEDI